MGTDNVIKLLEAVGSLMESSGMAPDKTTWANHIRTDTALEAERERLLQAIKALDEAGFAFADRNPPPLCHVNPNQHRRKNKDEQDAD